MIDIYGEPRVLDFGLARVDNGANQTALTMTGQFLGSLPWASPEQAEGKPSMIDVRTDVYSLGVILYQILTGVFPYEVAGNMRDILDNILHAEPTPPSDVIEASFAKAAEKQKQFRKKHPNSVTIDLDAIVSKALAKNRGDRYSDANEFGDDVTRYLAGQAVDATPQNRSAGLRSSLFSKMLGLAAILFVLAAIWAAWFYSPEQASTSFSKVNSTPPTPTVTPPSVADEVVDSKVPEDLPSIDDDVFSQLNAALEGHWKVPEQCWVESFDDSDEESLNHFKKLSLSHSAATFPAFKGNGFVLQGEVETSIHLNPNSAHIAFGIRNQRRNIDYSIYCDSPSTTSSVGYTRSSSSGKFEYLSRGKGSIPQWFRQPNQLTLVVRGRTLSLFANDRLAFQATGLPAGDWVPRIAAWNTRLKLSDVRVAKLSSKTLIPKIEIDERDQKAVDRFKQRQIQTVSILTPEAEDSQSFSVRLCYVDAEDTPFADEDLNTLTESNALTRIISRNASGVTDAGFSAFAGKPKLAELNLERAKVTGDTFSALTDSKELWKLRLTNCDQSERLMC